MRSSKRLAALAAVIALAGTLLLVSTGQAHSRPIRFDPAEGAILDAAPTEVHGWFTNDVRSDPNWTFIKVTDATGNVVSTGDPILSEDRRQISTKLQDGLGPGMYTVTWRTWDDLDGAIFGDCYNFFVGQAAADDAYQNKTRLDLGGKCDSIDVEAKDATPVPGQTPAASTSGSETTPDTGAAAQTGGSSSSGGGGVDTWVLIVGMAGALVVGLVGGRFLPGMGGK